VEMLGIGSLAALYRDRRVLITGHTGFKGSWLALWLSDLGAEVIGLALAPPSQPNHWDLLGLRIDDHRCDIRDARAVRHLVIQARPECIFHLAAQPLVRRSYAAPFDTWSTNVVGTASVVEAARASDTVQAVVVATTDKCYENLGRRVAYREDDRLGGHDPYSASKAATELVVASYRAIFSSEGEQRPLLASVRAGNVIGGGDWAEDRLIPDLVRAQTSNTALIVRSPTATRPWQHVLDCLAGYLQLGAALLTGRPEFARAWNFGPGIEESRTVAEVLDVLGSHWPELRWRSGAANGPHEAVALALDSTQARTLLGWKPVWSLDEALRATARWYREFLTAGNIASRAQLATYRNAAEADCFRTVSE
jgi:CDP-glucose 4,6-dehydratase